MSTDDTGGPGPDGTAAENPADQPGTPAGAEQDAAVKAAEGAAAPPASHEFSQEGRQAHEAAAKDALLRADDVVAGYVPGVNILNGCDLYVNDGELVGIIGPNGAGKSTLLKAIFGLIKVSTGSITLRGENITGFKANRLVSQGVGFVPQTNNVFPSLTIEENLQMGVFQAPKKFKRASSSSPACSPPSATAGPSGPGRCPAASGRWSRWAGR